MEKQKIKSLAKWSVIGVLGLLVLGGTAKALSGSFPIGIETCDNCNFTVNSQEDSLGASGTRFPNGISADSTSPNAGQLRGSTLAITGASVLSGDLNYFESTQAVSATTTLTIAESGKTFYLSGGQATYTLPATSTADGVVYRFVVSGSMTGTSTIATDSGGNAIEGTLIVAGAVVDCDAEDTITFVVDGENVGDFLELRSNGTNWFIGASGALTAGKLTCSAT